MHECLSPPSHMHNMSGNCIKEISMKIQISNEDYKHMADSHKRMKKFNEGNFVIIKLRLKRLDP